MEQSRISWRLGRRLSFAAGVVCTLTFAGPLFGAVWGFISIHGGSGGNNSGASAYRLYEGIKLRRYESDDLVNRNFRDESDCENAVHAQRWYRASLGGSPQTHLTVAIIRHHSDLTEGIRTNAAVNAISRLPTPILGALEGCIDASVLGSWCERYVLGVGERAVASKAVTADLAKGAAITESIWCMLANIEQK